MSAPIYNLNITPGYQLQKVFRLRRKDTGAYVDLTGSTPYAEVRDTRDGAVILDLSPTVTSAANGEITIDVADETTDALAEGIYDWDLMVENSDSERIGPYLRGTATVKGGITQP